MANITLRLAKGTPLTNGEVDNNFSNLNITKTEIGGDLSGNVFYPKVSGIRGWTVDSTAPGNAQVLVFYSLANAWVPSDITSTSSSGTLTYFSEASNVTYTYSSFTPIGAATDIDGVYAAKGAGATQANAVDRLASGGDKRGSYATDWQKARASNVQVASGNYSTIGGGRNNSALGLYSTTAGGISNNAAGTYSSISGGGENSALGQYSTVVGGYQNLADSNYSIVVGGRKGNTRSIVGYTVFPASNIPIQNISGASQAGILVLGCETTDATETILTSDSASPSSANQFNPANNSTVAFRGLIVARQVGGGSGTVGDSRAFSFEGSVTKDSSGTLSDVGEIVIHKLPESPPTISWSIAVLSESGILKVKVTGQTGKTIRWVCRLDTIEVSG